MIAVIGMLLILAAAGGLTGTLHIGMFVSLGLGVFGAVLLVAGIEIADQHSKRNGNIIRRG
jgi:hypothetical protein